MFLQSAAFGGVFTGFARRPRLRLRLRPAPAARARRGAAGSSPATRVGALLRWALTGTVVTIAALIAGMNVDGSGDRPRSVCSASASLVNLVAALWACGLAMFLRTEQAGALIQMPVFVLLFLAPVYVRARPQSIV